MFDSREMFPRLTVEHSPEGSIRKSRFLFDLFHRLAVCKLFSQLNNKFIREDRGIMTDASVIRNDISPFTAFQKGIAHISAASIKTKMIGVCASRIVACVQYMRCLAARQLDVMMQFISDPMSQSCVFPFCYIKNTVAFQGFPATPWPAFVGFFDIDLFPETFGKRAYFSHGET